MYRDPGEAPELLEEALLNFDSDFGLGLPRAAALRTSLGFALVLSCLTGCALDPEANEEDALAEASSALLPSDSFSNQRGTHRTISTSGSIDPNNLFFQSLGQNGRACVHCHQPSAAWSITPKDIKDVFKATDGADPLFRLVDGATSPTAPVGNNGQRHEAYKLLLNKGLIRIALALPTTRDFDIVSVSDPYGAQTASTLSFYRRPLPSVNLKFLSAVMWDGRETQPNTTIRDNLLTQANDATRGHAEAARDLTLAERGAIVDFQLANFVAQESDSKAGTLDQSGGLGGPTQLSQQPFFFGINDSHGGNPTGAAFNPNAMTLYSAWAQLTGGAANARRAAIQRGQVLFNSKPISISGVRGVNNVLGVTTLVGTCTTCHTTPNVGNHSDILPLDLGVSDPARITDNSLPVFTVKSRSSGQTIQTTDVGRAMISGRFDQVSLFKGPILRALVARPPYFHNGLADTLSDVVTFYNGRFGIGLTTSEQSDLVAFLEAL